METTTIKEIAKLRDEIKEALKTVDKSTYSSTYGSENEYSGKGIYLGLESLLVDISYLVRSHNQFIKISTYNERYSMKNLLVNINSYISSPSTLAKYVDELKVLLRSYNVSKNKERWELFQEANKKLLEQCDEFATVLVEANNQKTKIDELTDGAEEKSKELKSKFDELQVELETIEEYKSEIEDKSENLKSINSKLEEIKETADENLESIVNHLNEAKSNEKLIDGFAKKVQERENRLGELEQRTSENDKKLEEYETERKKVLGEAEQLIQNAKTALHYSTASGLSESFDTQYTAAKKWQLSALWIGGATFFILVAIGLGIWITVEKTSDLHLLIGRIALLPLPIVAAIFCSNQYVKQKNIIEDYAYKMVLAKSIVGFSEQLKKNPSEDNTKYFVINT
ncbi:hypothetical protein [Soonwooa sp.]|uniref:hypothetical protein n=1 Tax=Soonwooa sp. TaxID=1938592 RepID=UPI002612F0CD|nr:hypothetical protein [Soonwooa sp.]